MEYKREVLVPYLTELYGIEVTWHTLQNKYKKYYNKIQEDKEILGKKKSIEEIKLEQPVKSQKKKKIIIALLSFIVIVTLIGEAMAPGVVFYIGVMYIIFFLVFYKQVRANMEAERQKYAAEVRQYNEDCDNINTWKKIISEKEECFPIDLARREEVWAELEKCSKVKEKAYSIDIIPKQYRNLGSISYLYEYFSSSKATDLDNIIQTMILSDVNRKISNIEDRLNQIISNQHQIYQELSAIQQTAVSIHQQAVQISGQLTSLELAVEEQHKDTKELTDEVKMMRMNSDISTYLQLGTYLKMAQY